MLSQVSLNPTGLIFCLFGMVTLLVVFGITNSLMKESLDAHVANNNFLLERNQLYVQNASCMVGETIRVVMGEKWQYIP